MYWPIVAGGIALIGGVTGFVVALLQIKQLQLSIEKLEKEVKESNIHRPSLEEIRQYGMLLPQVYKNVRILDVLDSEASDRRHADKAESIQINDFLKTYLSRLWEHPRYLPVKLYYSLQTAVDTAGVVRASRGWLGQLFEILVDNAVEAMLTADSPKKELMVSTRARGEWIEISVGDTGPGIPGDLLEHIFEKPKPKPPGGRAGIGLMVAATIVGSCGGQIVFKSTGKGATVVVVLPMEKSADDRYSGAST